MSEKPVHTEVKSVVPGLFNAFVPGPTHEATTTYSDGSQKKGVGYSETEAIKNSKK